MDATGVLLSVKNYMSSYLRIPHFIINNLKMKVALIQPTRENEEFIVFMEFDSVADVHSIMRYLKNLPRECRTLLFIPPNLSALHRSLEEQAYQIRHSESPKKTLIRWMNNSLVLHVKDSNNKWVPVHSSSPAPSNSTQHMPSPIPTPHPVPRPVVPQPTGYPSIPTHPSYPVNRTYIPAPCQPTQINSFPSSPPLNPTLQTQPSSQMYTNPSPTPSIHEQHTQDQRHLYHHMEPVYYNSTVPSAQYLNGNNQLQGNSDGAIYSLIQRFETTQENY